MEKLKQFASLKVLCYVLAPILFLILMLSGIYLSFQNENTYDMSVNDYYQTTNFADNYYGRIRSIYYSISSMYAEIPFQVSDTSYSLIQNGEEEIYYQSPDYYSGFYQYFRFIIVDRQSQIIFTNIKTDNYEQEIENIKQGKYYWYYETENIQTDIEKIDEYNIRYDYGLVQLEQLKQLGLDFYIDFDEEQVEVGNSFYLEKTLYDTMMGVKEVPMYAIPITSVLLILIVIYLIWSIGHKKGVEGIYLNSLDKISYELVCIIAFFLFVIVVVVANAVTSGSLNIVFLSLSLISYLVAYTILATLATTTIKRLKAKTLFKELWIAKIYRWIKRNMENLIFSNTSIMSKVAIVYVGIIFISFLIVLFFHDGFWIILLPVFWGFSFYKIAQYMKQIKTIEQALKDIYEGKEEVVIDSQNLDKEFKQIATYVNDIAKGFSSAVEKSLKSERMKTELITNVSHDIKTPLTSIINYVDLLKKEEMPSEKAKEYLEVLDNKSQRLKRLTEDLVEASKASSGNIKLNMEILDVKELIKQVSGEFEDKFEEKHLELNTYMPKEDCLIKADSRYLYRVLENLYGNIVKYALESSRVYIDVFLVEGKVQIQMKNISKEKLNISAEELKQRFVRGEASRNTEGSGLGLSIAESLTNLQGGRFEIYLDGDLFKVIIEFERQKKEH